MYFTDAEIFCPPAGKIMPEPSSIGQIVRGILSDMSLKLLRPFNGNPPFLDFIKDVL